MNDIIKELLLLQKEVVVEEKPSKQEIILASKYEQTGIEHFSISSLNQFRNNSMVWALRYLLEMKSIYPNPALARGKAIENTINQKFLGSPIDCKLSAMNFYKMEISKDILGIFEILPENWQRDKIIYSLYQLPFDKFIDSISKLLDKLPNYQIEKKSWLNSEQNEKLMKKIQSEYHFVLSVIENATDLVISKLPQNSRLQNKLSHDFNKLPVPIIGYTDYENANIGIDLKTGKKLPKQYSDISVEHFCQASFYSFVQKKPWELLYVSSLSNTQKKEIIMYDLYKEYKNDVKKIVEQYKLKSLDGKGTTEKFVLEQIEKFQNPQYTIPESVISYTVKESEVDNFMKLNLMTANSINTVINSCRKSSLIDDMKIFCLDNPSGMFIDPCEKEQIEQVWGIKIVTEEDEI